MQIASESQQYAPTFLTGVLCIIVEYWGKVRSRKKKKRIWAMKEKYSAIYNSCNEIGRTYLSCR